VNRVGIALLALAAIGCAMDREQVLDKKLCDADGKCARGYRCQRGTCVLDTTSNASALSLADADAGSVDGGSGPR
jgi:hypothetical protein